MALAFLRKSAAARSGQFGSHCIKVAEPNK